MPRRRLSSEGFKLFNLAYSTPPKHSTIKRMLSCLFHSEYDDRLEEMTNSCYDASKQLFAYSTDPLRKGYINKFIDNSIFNVIYAVLCRDGELANAFQIQQNYRYFMDVLSHAHRNGDHNTAIMLRAALDHHSLKQMKIKLEKRGNKIGLRGFLPSKTIKNGFAMQRISFGQPSTAVGLRASKLLAELVIDQLNDGLFDWQKWSDKDFVTSTALNLLRMYDREMVAPI